MKSEDIHKIRRLVIIALASNDDLVEQLVLKGGNAIDLMTSKTGKKVSRVSFDLDYALEGGDIDGDIAEFEVRVSDTLKQTFNEAGYELYDFKFTQRPLKLYGAHAEFWGGYKITFKLLPTADFIEKFKGDYKRASLGGIRVNGDSTVFEVELSKYEYLADKTQIEVDGFRLFIYSPEMIAIEKIRALCQQLPEYKQIVPSFTPRQRARDYYDIYYIVQTHNINLASDANKQLLTDIFEAKRVPLQFLSLLKNNSGFHKENWGSVLETLPDNGDVNNFEFYSGYLQEVINSITSL